MSITGPPFPTPIFMPRQACKGKMSLTMARLAPKNLTHGGAGERLFKYIKLQDKTGPSEIPFKYFYPEMCESDFH